MLLRTLLSYRLLIATDRLFGLGPWHYKSRAASRATVSSTSVRKWRLQTLAAFWTGIVDVDLPEDGFSDFVAGGLVFWFVHLPGQTYNG